MLAFPVLLIEGGDFSWQICSQINTMTTTNISIQDLVQREVIYCVSSLIHTLTQEHKLEEEIAIELWTGPVDFDSALYEINQDGSYVEEQNGLWGLYDNGEGAENPIVDYEYETREELIEYYFDDMGWDLEQHRSEIFEHYIVTNWLANKLEALGETVVRNFYGLTIWARATTGQLIQSDWVIQEIYQELISK